VYLILKEVTLSGSTSILALPSSEPSVQGLALSRLQQAALFFALHHTNPVHCRCYLFCCRCCC
jgi:hypothetical protein